MAKGQVTDEELSSGLKGLGGFGALTGAKALKDSPFRDSRSEAPKVVEVVRPAVVEPPKPAPVPVRPEKLPAPDTKPERVPRLAKPKPVTQKVAAESGTRRVADVHTERITLQLSPGMRDDVDAFARELQRSRASKGERITGNTIMRVAIRILLDQIGTKDCSGASSEEELVRIIKTKFAHAE